MTRVVTYVDGFNLYFGLKSKVWNRHYWHDLHRLVTSLLKPGQTPLVLYRAMLERASSSPEHIQ